MNNDTQDIQFAIEARMFDGNWSEARKKAYASKKRSYKHCANYCRTMITDPANVRYNGDGSPRWTFEKLGVFDRNAELVWFDKFGGKVLYDRDILGPDTYGPTLYIVTAMMNAVHEVKTAANREMTTAEIEAEFGLKRGVVRKYIHDNKDVLVQLECIRKADARTWLCKRGWAINVWSQRTR